MRNTSVSQTDKLLNIRSAVEYLVYGKAVELLPVQGLDDNFTFKRNS